MTTETRLTAEERLHELIDKRIALARNDAQIDLLNELRQFIERKMAELKEEVGKL